MDEIASSALLHAAFARLRESRIDCADSADVWNARRRWAEIKPQLPNAICWAASTASSLCGESGCI